MKKVQELANEGYFVVAGTQAAPGEEHGHVVVVVPGKEEYSGTTWKCNVPVTMDTGKGHRWAYKKFSESFGVDKKPRIKFYIYKGAIKKQ